MKWKFVFNPKESIQPGDYFLDGDKIYMCSRRTDILIDDKGLWHNPKKSKKIKQIK